MCDFNGRYGAPGPPFARLSDLYTPVLSLLWPTFVEATATGMASPELLAGLAWAQSGFEPDALAPDGGEGLFSMQPTEARRLAPELGLHRPDLCHPPTAIRLASRSLNELMTRFDIVRALLAFRLGVPALEQGGDVLLSVPEHAQYIRDVLQTMAWVSQARPWRRRSSQPPATNTHAYRTLVRTLRPRPEGEGFACDA